MKSAVRKHSIYINRRKTSVSLENDFWFGLLEIAVIGRAHRQEPQDRQSFVGNPDVRPQIFQTRPQAKIQPPQETLANKPFAWPRSTSGLEACARNSGRGKDHDGNDRHGRQQAKDQRCLFPGIASAHVIILEVAECCHRIGSKRTDPGGARRSAKRRVATRASVTSTHIVARASAVLD